MNDKKTILKITVQLLCFSLFSITAIGQEQKAVSADTAFNQRDIIDMLRPLFFKNKSSSAKRDSGISNKKIYFSLLPASTGIPGGGAALVTSTNMSFYLGDKKNTSLSVVSFTPYTNFQGRYVFPIRSNIWLNNNDWNFIGDLRFIFYPQNSWGLGGHTPKEQETLISYKYVRFYESALKKISRNFFAGIGFNLDNHFDVTAYGDSGFYKSLRPYYDSLESNTQSTGISFIVQYDSRKNSNHPTGGMYASASFRANPSIFPNTGNWDQLFLDFRKYFSFSSKEQNILGFWSYYWMVNKGYIPYLDLPSTGWDPYARSGRGFYQSRYRSDKQLYFETEYRKDLTKNGLFGFVLFANLSSVSEFHTNDFIYWLPAGGAGLRLKLNKFSRTNIVFDYAFSKEMNTYYLNIGETF